MVNILIVEDEELQRKNLIKMIEELEEEMNIFEAEDEKDAIDIATENNIDLFYVDVSLKNSSGLELALKLRKMSQYTLSLIIFITTHKKYELSAFKNIHCYDYIVKPYKKEDVKKMTKLLIDNFSKNKVTKEKPRRFVLFDKNKISVKIYLEDIFFIEVSLRNVIIYTKGGRFEFNRLSLKKVMEMVCNNHIIQSHRSYIINIDNVKKIEKESSSMWKVSFDNYAEVAYISSKYKDEVDKYLIFNKQEI